MLSTLMKTIWWKHMQNFKVLHKISYTETDETDLRSDIIYILHLQH